MVPSCALRLAIFLYSKREAGKRQEVGPACRGARASDCARRGAGRECAAALMVVGSAHAPLLGIGQSEQAREMSNGHVMLMPCSARYI